MKHDIADVINDPNIRGDVIAHVTRQAIAQADAQTSSVDNFPIVAEGLIHDAMCAVIANLDDDLERTDDRGYFAERAYDLVWDPCATRIWNEARRRALEVPA